MPAARGFDRSTDILWSTFLIERLSNREKNGTRTQYYEPYEKNKEVKSKSIVIY